MNEVLIQLVFEIGRAYERLYIDLDLYNAINFNDIAFANSCGAQWNFKGDMSDFPKVLRAKVLNREKVNALKDLASKLEYLKKVGGTS